LIASRSDGSLRDAEMTLDQLSLLGQTISLSLVQELVRYLTSIIIVIFFTGRSCIAYF
jgi:DNA polymerase III gamma/tau subunit